jgi:xanthine dehydrogenase accessory factor
MMPAAMSRRAQELAARGEAFVTATVVRAQRPTSVKAGDVALVLEDGTVEGFVGGACGEHSVRAYSLKAIESGEPVLLRILPFAEEGDEGDPAGTEVAREEGAVTVQNPCLSGGAIEMFLEPVLPAPRVHVVGETPIASALLRIGPELGFEVSSPEGGAVDPRPGDLALIVAAHGQDELDALRRGLESGLPYVGLVASGKRGDGVIGELRGDGLAKELVEQIDVPAGLDIGARTPAEIALSILAKVIEVRRSPRRVTAIDPICGMTVAAVAGTPSVRHDGETVYFCCEGCKATFEQQHEHAVRD